MVTERRRVGSGGPPRVLLVVAAVLLPALVGILLAGAWTTGISYDEPFHVERLQHWFDHGWFVLADDLTAEGALGDWVTDAPVYSPVTALLAHLANVVLGVEVWGEVTLGSTAFAVRHLVVALLGVVGALAAGAVVRSLTASWRWGLVAVTSVLAVPVFTGMAMVNVKDAPVATGHLLVTLALVVALDRSRGALSWPRGAAPVAMFAGVLLAVGTRPGIWPSLAAVVGVALLFSVARRRREPGVVRATLVAWGPTLGAAVLALAVLVGLYPNVFATPAWLLDSVLSSAGYEGNEGKRTALLLAWVRNLPLLWLVGAGALAVVALRRARRSWWSRPRAPQVAVVAAQAFVVPFLTFVQASPLQGLRQVLFMVPAVVVLLVWAFARIWTQASERSPAAGQVLAALGSVALIVPTVVQAQLFPYSYTYASELHDLSGASTGNDYWQLSVRELADEIPRDEFVVCFPTMDDDRNVQRRSVDNGRSQFERGRDCRTDALSPFAPYTGVQVPVDEPVAASFSAITVADYGAANCREVAAVERPRHHTRQKMASLLSCRLVLPKYTGPVTFDVESTSPDPKADTSGQRYLMGGWTGSPERTGAVMREARADFALGLPGASAAGEHVLGLDLHNSVPLDVWVNNTRVGRLAPGDGWREVVVTDTEQDPLDELGHVVTLRTVGSSGSLGQSMGVRGGPGSPAPGDVVLRRFAHGEDVTQFVDRGVERIMEGTDR